MNLFSYIFIFLVIIGVLYFMDSLNNKVEKIELKELNTYIEEKKIEKIEITPKGSAGLYVITGKLKGAKQNETFTISLPKENSTIEKISIHKQNA